MTRQEVAQGQNFGQEELAAYLSRQLQQSIEIRRLQALGGDTEGTAALKGFGYGRPVCVTYATANATHKVVLRRVMRNGFGRERDSDRVAEVWRDYHTFNRLPQHVQVQDMVAVGENGRLSSVHDAQELILLTDYAAGTPYAEDFVRIRDKGHCTANDLARAETLARYLAQIHAQKHNDPLLWRRRLRDLIGHGEGILGLTDSYPLPYPEAQNPIVTQPMLQAIEVAANAWRWQLKPLTHRLSQVHGDFHPFNVLFRDGVDFSLIDRSRGEWGAPEDDVTCMAINYLFFSLQRSGKLTGAFEQLYNAFWNVYLAESGDKELLSLVAPWFAWRALVVASPQWYPTIADEVRCKLLNFARNVLLAKRPFCPADTNDYLTS